MRAQISKEKGVLGAKKWSYYTMAVKKVIVRMMFQQKQKVQISKENHGVGGQKSGPILQ